MKKLLQQHPNAATALVGGSGGGLLVEWLLNDVVHLAVPAKGCVVIAAGIGSAALYIGKRGLKRALPVILRRVWRGTDRS